MKITNKQEPCTAASAVPDRRSNGRIPLAFLTIAILLSVVPAFRLSAQTPLGSWRTHPSFRSAQSVAAVRNKVYCASENGFFYYDPAADEAVRLNRDDGFSTTGVTRLFYLADQQRLLIGYRDGTIDFLSVTATGEPDGIQALTLIRDAAQIGGSKRINHILRPATSSSTDLFLACDFGIVVLDLSRTEIRDTYRNIGPNGSSVAVYSTALANDSIYAVTSGGLLAARFAPTVNLAFFGNWRPIPLPQGAVLRSVAGIGNRLLVAVSGQGIAERQGGKWTLATPSTAINGLLTSGSEWVSVSRNSLRWESGSYVENALLAKPKELAESGGERWVADSLNGLLRLAGNTVQAVGPDGPASDIFQRLTATAGQLVALPGGFTDALTPLGRRRGFDRYIDNRWQAFTDSLLDTDFVSAAYEPTEQRFYLASYGGGLWGLGPNALPEVISRVLRSISGLAISREGDLWMTTPLGSSGGPALHVRRKNGQIQSFSTGRIDLLQPLIDDNGYLWIRLSALYGGGLLVFDPATNRSRMLSTLPDQGALPGSGVRSLASDRSGAIWIGTDRGVAVFDNPAGIFTGSATAYLPIADGQRLLANEPVTAIAVDGGNRKWFGTRNGLYLYSADGTGLLAQFTTDNSLLPSNNILDLAIEPVAGDVFVATEAGLASYRGSATEPAPALTGIRIFPNPVRPDFGGVVGINGLVENTVVKIMDTAGQLVYETRSQGGTASWDLRDYRGRAAQSGVYFIVAITPDGQEGLAGKLAVVR